MLNSRCSSINAPSAAVLSIGSVPWLKDEHKDDPELALTDFTLTMRCIMNVMCIQCHHQKQQKFSLCSEFFSCWFGKLISAGFKALFSFYAHCEKLWVFF